MKSKYNFLNIMRNAQSVIAEGSQFVVFGEMHSQTEDRKVFCDLIPAMKQKGVRIIGLELSPKFNDFFAQLQSDIKKNHPSIAAIESRLNNKFRDGGLAMPEGQITPKLAEIFTSATKNGVRIVGIDPRMDDPEFTRRLNSGEGQNQDAPNGVRLVDTLGHDGEAAANAFKELAKEPAKSRMAILYGNVHAKADGIKNVDRPPILAEELQKYGSVSTSELVQPGSMPNIKIKNYRAIEPDVPPITPEQLGKALRDDPEFMKAIGELRKELKVPWRKSTETNKGSKKKTSHNNDLVGQ